MTNHDRPFDFGVVDPTSPSLWQFLVCPPESSGSTPGELSPNTAKGNRQIWSISCPTQFVPNYDVSPASLHTNESSDEYSRSSTVDERDKSMAQSGSVSTVRKDNESTPSMHLRRRAQNRASQRAFRERQLKHLKGVESQLEILHEKHQDLLQSYSRQSDEVSRLSDKIWQLTNELNSRQYSPDLPASTVPMVNDFKTFDGFSTYEKGYDRTFDKVCVELDPGFALYTFDDLL